MTQCNDAMQVAYTAMIPCMLFTKCAATLASSRSWVLITLPLTAVLQVTPLTQDPTLHYFDVALSVYSLLGKT